MLLSIRGVGSVVLNQWESSLSNNLTFLVDLIEQLYTSNKTIGDAILAFKQAGRVKSRLTDAKYYNPILYGLPIMKMPRKRDRETTSVVT